MKLGHGALIVRLLIASLFFGLGYYLGMEVCGMAASAFRSGADMKDAYLY